MANIPPRYHHPYPSSLNQVRRHSSSPQPTTVFLKPPSFKHLKLSTSLNSSDSEASQPANEAPSQTKPDPVKLAFERAQKYKKAKQSNSDQKSSSSQQTSFQLSNGKSDGTVGNSSSPNTGDEGRKEVPLSVKLALERAKEYKKDRGVAGTLSSDAKTTEVKEGNRGSTGDANVEKRVSKSKGLTVSSIDFVGLNFADKKEGRALPAGLMPVADPFPEGDLPEVEFIAGDTSKFTDEVVSATEENQEDDNELYKPKVSTWGVFPRPNNISKTFGGGKVIRPGQILETAEEKAAKQAKTRQLIEAYNTKIGLNIDPKLKAECEKALNDGDSLMDSGNLKDALPYYEIVMNKLVFQTKLHGLAALQWSICQDSLSRKGRRNRLSVFAMEIINRPSGHCNCCHIVGNEARSMYERLQSHPNPQVSKKARQFVFSFQAMEMMKVSSSSSMPLNKTEYQEYFDAFVKNESRYPPGGGDEAEEGVLLSQALPYILFLASPVVFVLGVAVQKGLLLLHH